MTDNDQYTPTDEQVERLARAFFAHTKEGRDGFSWPLNGEKDRERDMEEARRILIRVLGPDSLAAHRVTLEADSREALAKGIEAGWGNPTWDGVTLRPIDRQIADALLASGVVQVTTHTETDEEDETGERISTGSLDGHDPLWVAGYQVGHREGVSDALASRPAPVAPPTEEDDVLEQRDYAVGLLANLRTTLRHLEDGGRLDEHSSDELWTIANDGPVDENGFDLVHIALKQKEAEAAASYSDLVPVDALGFPTQEGATFRARKLAPAYFTVVEPGMFEYRGGGFCEPQELDPTSIEDVRPADGRGGQ